MAGFLVVAGVARAEVVAGTGVGRGRSRGTRAAARRRKAGLVLELEGADAMACVQMTTEGQTWLGLVLELDGADATVGRLRSAAPLPAPVPVRRVRTRRERLPRVRGHQERLAPCPPFLTIQLRAPAGKELKTGMHGGAKRWPAEGCTAAWVCRHGMASELHGI